MKKTYFEPTVKEINVRFEAVMAAGSPGTDELPGYDGLGNNILDDTDEGLAKKDIFGW